MTEVSAAYYSPNGRWIATSSWDGTSKLWDAKSYEEVTKIMGHIGFVNKAVFSPNSEYIATAGQDGTVRLWKIQE